MTLRLFSSAEAYVHALRASGPALHSICNSDSLPPAELLRLERAAAEHGHRELLEAVESPDAVERDILNFFTEAAQLDPQWQFAYSAKVVLSVPGFVDLQKIFVLRRYFMADRPDEALLLVPDRRLRELFAACFDLQPSHSTTVLPSRRAWGRCARTLLRSLVHRRRARHTQVVIFTLSSGAPGPSDTYFGALPEVLGRTTETLTVYLASGPRVRLPADASRAPLESFLSAPEVLRVWATSFFSGLSAARRGLTNQALAPLHRFIRENEIRMGEYFSQQLLARAFKRVFAAVQPRVVVYPFENRSWEKHLLAASAASSVRCRIAYQHSSITPRHLAFDLDDGTPLPDRVITIGEITGQILRQRAPALVPRLEVAVGLRAARQAVASDAGTAVLVAISSNRNEALRLLHVTRAAAAQLDVPFVIRTHPTIPVDDLFGLFDWSPNVELSRGRTLAEDLSRASWVAYSSSTVALEGMLYRRLPIFVDIGDLPSGDPLSGEHPFKHTARNGDELASAIRTFSIRSPAELSALQVQAQHYAERYLREPNAEAIEQMATRIATA